MRRALASALLASLALAACGKDERADQKPVAQKGDPADEAFELLQAQLEPGDLVLFKSSNGIGLRHLGDRIASPLESTGIATEGSAL